MYLMRVTAGDVPACGAPLGIEDREGAREGRTSTSQGTRVRRGAVLSHPRRVRRAPRFANGAVRISNFRSFEWTSVMIRALMEITETGFERDIFLGNSPSTSCSLGALATL